MAAEVFQPRIAQTTVVETALVTAARSVSLPASGK